MKIKTDRGGKGPRWDGRGIVLYECSQVIVYYCAIRIRIRCKCIYFVLYIFFIWEFINNCLCRYNRVEKRNNVQLISTLGRAVAG